MAINVLSWCVDPLVLLQAVGKVVPKLLLAQAVLDRRVNRIVMAIPYLLGMGSYLTCGQFNEMLKTAGWRVERRIKFPTFTVVASKDGSGRVRLKGRLERFRRPLTSLSL